MTSKNQEYELYNEIYDFVPVSEEQTKKFIDYIFKSDQYKHYHVYNFILNISRSAFYLINKKQMLDIIKYIYEQNKIDIDILNRDIFVIFMNEEYENIEVLEYVIKKYNYDYENKWEICERHHIKSYSCELLEMFIRNNISVQYVIDKNMINMDSCNYEDFVKLIEKLIQSGYKISEKTVYKGLEKFGSIWIEHVLKNSDKFKYDITILFLTAIIKKYTDVIDLLVREGFEIDNKKLKKLRTDSDTFIETIIDYNFDCETIVNLYAIKCLVDTHGYEKVINTYETKNNYTYSESDDDLTFENVTSYRNNKRV